MDSQDSTNGQTSCYQCAKYGIYQPVDFRAIQLGSPSIEIPDSSAGNFSLNNIWASFLALTGIHHASFAELCCLLCTSQIGGLRYFFTLVGINQRVPDQR